MRPNFEHGDHDRLLQVGREVGSSNTLWLHETGVHVLSDEQRKRLDSNIVNFGLDVEELKEIPVLRQKVIETIQQNPGISQSQLKPHFERLGLNGTERVFSNEIVLDLLDRGLVMTGLNLELTLSRRLSLQ